MAETLFEEREEEMVSPSGGSPSWRIAHFLKPTSQNPQILHTLPKRSIPINPNLQSLNSKLIKFHGWICPPKKWASWVEKLRPSFEPIWRETSIFEPIMASTLKFPRSYDTLVALAERWCPATKSFAFPWGESTITLEDVMVLWGYSATGDSVLTPCSKELCEIDKVLIDARSKLNQSKSKKPSQQQWMAIWMEKGGEHEHEAFLSLWLSRFVLPPADSGTINKHVFPIAILLARGTTIALAPTVLASIYRDLRRLKEKIGSLDDQDDENGTKLRLWAPLQLLQVWFCERFPTLSPEPTLIEIGQPRSARWSNVRILIKDEVGLAMDSARDKFRWRPYCTPLNNWSMSAKLYPEKPGWVSDDSDNDLDLQSYARCIRVSELVGLDYIEQYLPQRVCMQFGLDQDIPIDIPCENGNPEVAWSNYNRPIRDVKLFMPPRLFESDVTQRYLRWWKKLDFLKGQARNLKREKDQIPSVNRYQDSPKKSIEMTERERIILEYNEDDVPPGFSPKGQRVVMNPSSDEPSSKRSKASAAGPGTRMERDKEEDSDCDDHLSLSQLFKLDRASIANKNGTCLLSQSQIPSSSAGNNESIRETKFRRNCTESFGPSEGNTKRGSNIGDGIESKVGSPTKSPMGANKKEVGTSCCYATQECEEIDLAGRIARLRRIVDVVKAEMTSQP